MFWYIWGFYKREILGKLKRMDIYFVCFWKLKNIWLRVVRRFLILRYVLNFLERMNFVEEFRRNSLNFNFFYIIVVIYLWGGIYVMGWWLYDTIFFIRFYFLKLWGRVLDFKYVNLGLYLINFLYILNNFFFVF